MATAAVAPLARGERDPEADLLRWPVDHLKDCPAATDRAEALRVVEFYRSERMTEKKPPRDVSDTRPSVAIMVAHCCLCGGITYHDL